MTDRSHWRGLAKQTLHLPLVAISHTVVAIILLSGGLLMHHIVVEYGDPKLYDLVPLRYVVDTIDLGVLGAYIVFGTRSFARAISAEDEK